MLNGVLKCYAQTDLWAYPNSGEVCPGQKRIVRIKINKLDKVTTVVRVFQYFAHLQCDREALVFPDPIWGFDSRNVSPLKTRGIVRIGHLIHADK